MADRLFTDAQLQPHLSWWARAWHLARTKPPLSIIGWRPVAESASFTGTIVKGETDPDGDTCFDLRVSDSLLLHCEVDPTTLKTFAPALATLYLGDRVTIGGRFVLDMGHNDLELHPVTSIRKETT